MKSVITSAARHDILGQYGFYLLGKDAEAVAERFLDAVQSTIEQICTTPRIGKPKHLTAPRLAGLRAWPIKGFATFRVYYLLDDDTVRIVRVLHGKRDINATLEDDWPES